MRNGYRSGLVPLPVFLLLHVSRELSLAFVSDVSELVRRAPSVFSQASALVLVFLPLVVHVGSASWLLVSGRPPRQLEPDVPPLARRVSRLSALGALAFLLYHGATFPLATLRGQAAAEDAGLRLVALLSSTVSGMPLSGALYLLGLLATSAHAGLAVHRGLLSEGLLREPARRRVSARLCGAGAALSFWLGALAVIRVASGVVLR